MAVGIGRRQFITALGGAVAAWPRAVRAQQGAKRVGLLMTESEGSSDTNARVAVFEATLKELGWTPGRNLQIDYRWAMGDSERIRSLAVDLVSSAPGQPVGIREFDDALRAGSGRDAFACGDPEGDPRHGATDVR